MSDRLLGEFSFPESEEGGSPPQRRIFVAPEWDDEGEHKTLVWLEVDSRVETWTPETPEELAEAERFYRACHSRSWNTLDELRSMPQLPGRWLIAWRMGGTTMYINTLDEAILFALPDSPESEMPMFATDPAEAAVMTHGHAIDLIPRLMVKLDIKEGDDDVYLEPVSLEAAVQPTDDADGQV